MRQYGIAVSYCTDTEKKRMYSLGNAYCTCYEIEVCNKIVAILTVMEFELWLLSVDGEESNFRRIISFFIIGAAAAVSN